MGLRDRDTFDGLLVFEREFLTCLEELRQAEKNEHETSRGQTQMERDLMQLVREEDARGEGPA